MYVVGKKAEGAELFKFFDNEAPGTDHRAAGFGICHAGFWSCFGTHYAAIPWNGSAYFVLLYVGSM